MRLTHTDTTLTIEVASEADTDRLGAAIAGIVKPGTTIGLNGPLGAGKTRLVRAIAAALGVDPFVVSSPTFVLIHEYQGRLPVYHFDAYRLDGPESFEALGVADYWDADGICLVEWADRVVAVMPRSMWTINIELTGPESRRVRVIGPDQETQQVLVTAIRDEF